MGLSAVNAIDFSDLTQRNPKLTQRQEEKEPTTTTTSTVRC